MRKTLFILGDSISIDYTPFLREFLGEEWWITRKGDLPAPEIEGEPDPMNGGDSGVFLSYLKAMLPKIASETLLLNCGLHDIKHQPTAADDIQVPLATYLENLREAVQLIRSAGKKAFWVTITPVDDRMHARHIKEFFRFDADAKRYNRESSQLMKSLEVPVIDLGGFTHCLPGNLYRDHVHFIEEVSRLQAAYLAGALQFESH